MASKPANRPTASAPPSLVRALRHLLRPFVRLLLHHRFTHPELVRLLKAVYLEVGAEELAAGGEPATGSRLSLLTGLHRKDVRSLREEGGAYRAPAAVSLGARLVSRWTGEPPFVDRRGRPRTLPRVGAPSAADPGASFEALVASVSTDIRPRAVLDEWLRLGIVELDARDRVRLRVEGFVPTAGFDEKAHYFGRNLHDHIATASHNLEAGAPPWLERSVHYGGLSAASIEELGTLSEKLGMGALRAVERRARALQRRDARAGTAVGRINFGVYFFHDDVSDATPAGDGDE